jgi:hypothetical protein
MPDKKEDDIGSDKRDYSASGQAIIFALLIFEIFAIIMTVKSCEEADAEPFEAICNHPRDIEGLTCFELQNAIMVCPDASELFNEMNCSMANRTMVMVR